MKILSDSEWKDLQKQLSDRDWECRILLDSVKRLQENVGEGLWSNIHNDPLSPDRVTLTDAVEALIKHLGVELAVHLPEPKRITVITGRVRAEKT